MKKLIYSVTDVYVELLKSTPPILRLNAEGFVNSGGWSDIKLIPSDQPSIPELHQFEFVGTPPGPGEIVTQGFEKVNAFYDFPVIPQVGNAIEVSGKVNSIKINVNFEAFLNERAAGFHIQPKLEKLKGIRFEKDRIIFRVPSNGCTDKNSFVISANCGFTNLPPCRVTVHRIVADYCDAYLPDGAEIECTYDELGMKDGYSFIVENEFER
jgi:hypothetical protein